MRFQYNPAVEDALRKDPAVKKALRDVGEDLADATEQRRHMTRSSGRYGRIEVTGGPGRDSSGRFTKGDDGVQVVATGPFAAIDEWGSANSAPTGAMRAAAAAAGRFEEH